MSQRRRRADNFTDSLNSFQTTTESEINSDILYSISQDSLDVFKSINNHTLNDASHSTTHSIMLSDNSVKYINKQDLYVSSVVCPSIQHNPDLNKRIDSVHIEHLCNKTDNDKENNNPQCFLKDKQLKNDFEPKKLANTPMLISQKTVVSHTGSENILNENSKRDTNHNIDNNESTSTTLQQNVHNSVSESQFTSVSDTTNENKPTCDINSECEDVNKEVSNFETILCSLDNQLNQMEENTKSEILKRLSNKFMHSPQNFTEKLLTIIEESVIHSDTDTHNTSALNLSRLTMEFKKMCKFIEDESAPEWVLSPPSISLCSKEVVTNPACNKLNHINTCKTETSSLTSPRNISTSVTPLSGADIVKKRFFNKIKNNFGGSVDSVVNISLNESNNASFEHLEALCRRLFPEERERSKPLRRRSSVPTLLHMNQIKDMCAEQMASLNVSNATIGDHKENITLSTPNLPYKCKNSLKQLESNYLNLHQELCSKLKKTQYDKISYSKKKSTKISEKSDITEVKSDKGTSGYPIVDPDELEKTILQDIADKRKRCLDTARLITEINADSEVLEAQKSLHNFPLFANDNESNSLINDETKFIKTLMSCKNYQTYLEKQKPLFKLFQNSNPCTPEVTFENTKTPDLKYKTSDSKKDPLNVKKTNTKNFLVNTNMKSCSPCKSSLSKKKDEEKEDKKENIKPKFFVTPGKTPPDQNFKRKKTYFPSLNSPIRNTKEKHILKSPHAEGLYRLNYNTIISPVGMYIRGTDMQLIKNVHAKRDNLLFTPRKQNINTSPRKNLKQNTPSKGIKKTNEKQSLKIASVSPKLDTNYVHEPETIRVNAPENDSTPKSHFVLPKVSYKLPLQVRTIKEDKSPKPGPRVKKLLECAQSKVVIRHQARSNSIKKPQTNAHDGVYEIYYEPEDESIHIEQAANKTNFICKQKNN